MRVLLSGGGTAGHVWPLIAVAETLQLRHPDTELLYVGGRGVERELVPEAGLDFRSVRTGKFRRYGADWWKDPTQLWANLKDVFNVVVGVVQALVIIRRFRPQVVLAKGGYVPVPVGIAAWLLRVPLVLHETDLVMGLANRILSRFATRVAVPQDRGIDPKYVETGQPIRAELFREQPHTFFASVPELPILLVIGGSQGARGLNRPVFAALPELLAQARVIHLTGAADAPQAAEAALALPAQLGAHYYPASFLVEEYPAALQQATLLLTRAGGTLWEAAALGKPSVVVPLPHAAGDHQRVNARLFEAEGAAVVVEQDELTAERLVSEVQALLSDATKLRAMGESAKALAHPDAAERLAEVVVGSAQRRFNA